MSKKNKKQQSKVNEFTDNESVMPSGLPNDWAVIISSFCLIVAGYLFSNDDIYGGFSIACYVLAILIGGVAPLKTAWMGLRLKKLNVAQLIVVVVVVLVVMKQLLASSLLLFMMTLSVFFRTHRHKKNQTN
ncbi:hypothetical protein CBF34_09190 [Vagococcus penaei]|uniref:Uncharacterized protein n=1 Tax=Vagococcus penaei TaxID=633807 RepID=A0A1Q2D5W8_9ENTE|nr:hypothetical protein [Vagococcus penaei]AQP53723.1 hypothetical protein BW732_05360 [Vagococcus penaei]RST99472.1 hypothetical protein CBF34_09190 [Vagococcus penaei]